MRSSSAQRSWASWRPGAPAGAAVVADFQVREAKAPHGQGGARGGFIRRRGPRVYRGPQGEEDGRASSELARGRSQPGLELPPLWRCAADGSGRTCRALGREADRLHRWPRSPRGDLRERSIRYTWYEPAKCRSERQQRPEDGRRARLALQVVDASPPRGTSGEPDGRRLLTRPPAEAQEGTDCGRDPPAVGPATSPPTIFTRSSSFCS